MATKIAPPAGKGAVRRTMLSRPKTCSVCQARITSWTPLLLTGRGRHSRIWCSDDCLTASQTGAPLRKRVLLHTALQDFLAFGAPQDHYGGGVQCAYCGVTTEARLAGVGHAELCAWAVLKEAARRTGVAG